MITNIRAGIRLAILSYKCNKDYAIKCNKYYGKLRTVDSNLELAHNLGNLSKKTNRL